MDKATRQQVENWFQDAPADDAITAAVAGLKRVAMLPTEHRERFAEKVKNDPSAVRALEGLQTVG
jgi:hypothetical protein